MAIQTAPGTLAIASQLSAGIGAESVAMAKIGQASNKLAEQMNGYAQDEYQQGVKMATVMEWAKYIQIASFFLIPITLGLGSLASVGAAEASTALTQVASAVGNAAVQGAQVVISLGQGATQVAKGYFQSEIQIDEAATDAIAKSTGSSSDAVKDLSQGTSKVASAIATMAESTGTIARQKII